MPAMSGGAPVVPFTEEQIYRYSRHIVMPQVGGKGQRKLLNAKVLLVGAGGLGSPTAMYLAAAGVGTLGIVDFDVVDITNLQRQILHHTHDIGRPKAQSAAETIADINPDVNVVQHRERICSDNALEIMRDYDIVVDGTDNVPTRYLAIDACVLLGKPNVHGSIFLFEGQAAVFKPGQGCYRCLYPTPPPPGMVPSCAEAGVLGVLPGIIGVIQAIETIKIILGLGEALTGRLLLFDALSMDFRTVKIRRDPKCPICGDHPTIHELIDYDDFCGVRPHAVAEERA
ncbi:MAG: molybdopterin-synthase adenylyltransferase MoeB [Chloroflexi bacterium]|nr:molybdopterin-synthase adenylyltransferase MoeB [Chloroflexota bacterium]